MRLKLLFPLNVHRRVEYLISASLSTSFGFLDNGKCPNRYQDKIELFSTRNVSFEYQLDVIGLFVLVTS